jgi:hypothetical protein
VDSERWQEVQRKHRRQRGVKKRAKKRLEVNYAARRAERERKEA